MFDSVVVESGPTHYAEPFRGETFLKMPANALVNLGYILVGLMWLPVVSRFSATHRSFAVLFCIVSIFYGPIQFGRIVTQSRMWGILDQWITLPFFAVVVVWNLKSLNLRTPWCLLLLCCSVASYGLAGVFTFGFEIALAAHIVAVAATCLAQWSVHSSAQSNVLLLALLRGLLWCFGFVILKLFDHSVTDATESLFGTRLLSGHFLSKLCDIMQIHAALTFFWMVSEASRKKSK